MKELQLKQASGTMRMCCVALMVVSLVGADRDARWLLRGAGAVEKVRTVTQTKMASCVVVAPSLPPCGKPGIAPTAPTRIMATKAASMHEMPRGQRWLTGSKESPGWGEYFGLTQATNMNTITHYETASYTDPGAVVTFSVVGCQPSRLPFDLPYCKNSTSNITGQ